MNQNKKVPKKRISSGGGVKLINKDNSPSVDYSDYINSTRASLDNNNKEIVIRMFENAAFLTSRIKTAMATFNTPMSRIVKDIAQSPVGNRNLAPNTIYQYMRAHEFLMDLKSDKPVLYKRLLSNAEKGLTRFNHVVAISRSPVSMSQKLDVIKSHLDGKDNFISKKSLEIHLGNMNDVNKGEFNNFWAEENIMKNFLQQYVNDGEKVYAPFGTEGEHDSIIVPKPEVQERIIELGFLEKNKTNAIPSESVENVLIHLPQHNLIFRSNSSAGRNRYKNFPVSNYDDLINRTEFMIKEAFRTLIPGGILGVVTWNTEWNGELKDFNFDVRMALEQNFEWMNSSAVMMSGKMRNWFPRQAYRMAHIVRKI
jgi:hypothetical protein